MRNTSSSASPRPRWALLAMLAICPFVTLARDATQPTATTLTPAQADLRWQQAVRRFDQPRQELLDTVAAGDAHGPFRPKWRSLQAYRAPAWFGDAKFGIFVHWGVYAVPAFANEWYPRNMYKQGTPEYAHQLATHGPLGKFGYKDYIPGLTAAHWDPARWAALFRAAGARYVIGVAQHSDGFAMYDSRLSDWTAVKMGPHRDVIGELGKAVRAAGLHFGVSSHTAENDWFFDHGREVDSDVNDPRYAGLYGPAVPQRPAPDDPSDMHLAADHTYVSQAWVDDWLARTAELEKYYHPDLLYLDWWVGQPAFRHALPKLLAYYYNAGASRGGVVLTYKLDALAAGSGTLDVERGQLGAIRPQAWQTDTTISRSSWGYVEHDSYRDASEIVQLLADVVSKNGNLLLDVGPRPDGTLVAQEREVLQQIGDWLRVNGAAIYASRPWRVFGEGPTRQAAGAFQEQAAKAYTAQDFRFTQRDGRLYAIELGWPQGGSATITALAPADGVRQVRLLGADTPVSWRSTPRGLVIQAGGKPPAGPAAYVYEIELAGVDRAGRQASNAEP